MKRLLVVAMSVATVLALALPAQAARITVGAYTQEATGLQCTGDVLSATGGTISATIQTWEVRPQTDHFRTAYVESRMVVQRYIGNGVWVRDSRSAWYDGTPAPTFEVDATTNGHYFDYGEAGTLDSLGNPLIRITAQTTNEDFLYRVVARTRFISDEDLKLVGIVDTGVGSCRL